MATKTSDRMTVDGVVYMINDADARAQIGAMAQHIAEMAREMARNIADAVGHALASSAAADMIIADSDDINSGSAGYYIDQYGAASSSSASANDRYTNFIPVVPGNWYLYCGRLPSNARSIAFYSLASLDAFISSAHAATNELSYFLCFKAPANAFYLRASYNVEEQGTHPFYIASIGRLNFSELLSNIDAVRSAISDTNNNLIQSAALRTQLTQLIEREILAEQTAREEADTALSGRMDDAEDDIIELGSKKVPMPLSSGSPTYGTSGQVLRTNGDGTTQWVAVGLPTDEQTAAAITAWLNDHPDATTTVQDHSLTHEKLVPGTLNYVTPEMFGAVGDGETDDSSALQDAIDYGLPVLFGSNKTYLIDSELTLIEGTYLLGGNNTVIKWSEPDTSRSKISADQCDNIRIENIIFTADTDVAIEDRHLANDIKITQGKNIRIIKCTFLNSHGTALCIHSDSFSSIEECHFEDITGGVGNPGECIYGQNFHDVEIIGCSCNHVGDHFLYVDGHSDLYNVTISNCNLNDTGNNELTNGAAISIYNNAHDITIANCTIRPYGAGIYFSIHSNETICSHNITVVNCTITGGTHGILIHGNTDTYKANHIIVQGCKVQGVSVDGIEALCASHVMISNCILESITRYSVSGDNLYDSIISDIIINDVKANGVGLILGSGRGGAVCDKVTVSNIQAYTTEEEQGAYSIYFRSGTNFVFSNLLDDGNFLYGIRYPASYKAFDNYSVEWTPYKDGGSSYTGNIDLIKAARYTVTGNLVYIYAEFTVDEPGVGNLILAGLPNNLIQDCAMGNTVVSNNGTCSMAKIDGRTTENKLIAYFIEDVNPIVSSGNTVQVWAVGKKK